MFRRFQEMRENGENGFTLIELLVVILIIAILAAIAIPVFLKQREKGWASQVTSSLKDASTAEESYATENDGSYTAVLANLNGQGFTNSVDVTVTPGTYASGAKYCLKAVSTHAGAYTGQTQYFDSATGAPTNSVPAGATCP
jgi:type IV pilus assembly protein PilA